MKKFREYIYCDNEKLDSFINQISEFDIEAVSKTAEQSDNVDGKIGAAIFKVDSSISERTSTNYKINNNSVEKFMDWIFDSENVINYEGQLLKYENIDNLIKICGELDVPELSSQFEAFTSIKDNNDLMSMVEIDDMDKSKLSIISSSENIPILIDDDYNYLFSGILKKNYLISPVNDFLDLAGENITIIGKIDKVYNNEDEVEIYNLAKEIFKINRSMLRSISSEEIKKFIVTEKGPLIKISPIIIYK